MSAAFSLDNLTSWLVQFSVIVGAGTVLPAIFRIRHPKSQLVYYHGILVLGLVFPFIQTWQHSLVIVSSSAASPGQAAPGLPWAGILLAVAGVGFAARLCWLAAGLWQLRRYERSAIPLHPLPASIKEARMRTGADALFCVSKDVRGPATVGFIEPVVLLPPSFLALDEDAQRSIACHELLHVRRNDWLVTVAEEVVGALLWFHPAAWFLLAKVKLTREQAVDAEVVRMTAPTPYIEALLSMAVVSKGRLAVPTAPFFTEGHLVHRMRSLLASPQQSFARLCALYVSVASLLGLSAAAVLVLFPLNGEAQIVAAFAKPHPAIADFVAGKRIAVQASARQAEFNLGVPAPDGAVEDIVYVINVEASENAGGLDVLVPPPPPPPPPPGTIQVFTQGVRLLRPGVIASPEQVQQFVASFPERSLVEVTQGEDGTVHKVMIIRRPANETTTIPPGFDVFGGFAGPDAATGATDRVH
jgi:beta-lactamase regulating signal transducer with metallopeptidase domain